MVKLWIQEMLRVSTRQLVFVRQISYSRPVQGALNEQSSESAHFDVAVVGGGIVGVATARELLIQKPNLKVVILEKEGKLAAHQTGHNSGVIHAGIYYKPGSLKALLCAAGLRATYAFCDKHNIPYKKCGKVIVALNEGELQILEYLYRQGVANDVPDIQVLDKDGLKKLEPHCQGIKAIYSPHTGIVDWAVVTEHCGRDFEERGGKIRYNYEVTYLKDEKFGSVDKDTSQYPIIIEGNKGQVVTATYVITCGGLQADKLANLSFDVEEPKIIPFRGEYLVLSQEKSKLINGNIYPVPDPRFPFLGVHFTPKLDGTVWIGPNAVLAFAREGYRWRDVKLKELYETLKYPGFHQLARKYFETGYKEMLNSIFIGRQLKHIQNYIPEITYRDVSRGPAGVRAQALNRDGTLVDGFELQSGTRGIEKRVLHCRNAPSPSATSCFPIARFIYLKAKTEFGL